LRKLLIVGVVCLSAAACGGSPNKPTQIDTPSGPMFTEVVGTVSADELKVHDGYVQTGGNVSIVLTWSGSADLDLGVVEVGSGNFVGSSENATGNREEVRFTAPTGYRFVIGVYGYSGASATQYKIRIESPRNLGAAQTSGDSLVSSNSFFPRSAFSRSK
jgi:hypothetical protein